MAHAKILRLADENQAGVRLLSLAVLISIIIGHSLTGALLASA